MILKDKGTGKIIRRDDGSYREEIVKKYKIGYNIKNGEKTDAYMYTIIYSNDGIHGYPIRREYGK